MLQTEQLVSPIQVLRLEYKKRKSGFSFLSSVDHLILLKAVVSYIKTHIHQTVTDMLMSVCTEDMSLLGPQ